jgi:hypothetical protein
MNKMSEEEKKAKAMSVEKQEIFYRRLLSKYQAAERNLESNPEKCGGEEYIKGYMSGLLDGMVLLNPNLTSTTNMGVESED